MITNNFCDHLRFRIALTEGGLDKGHLFLRGIPAPITSPYKTFFVEVSQSQGGKAQHGYSHVELTWDVMEPRHVNYLKNLVDQALAAGGTIFLTIPKNEGSAVGRTFIDCSGLIHPTDFEEAGSIQGSFGMVYGPIKLTINALQIINDPAIF